MIRLKPERFKGIKVSGIIVDFDKSMLKFTIGSKREELKIPRVHTVENGDYVYFRQPAFRDFPVQIVYLNKESLLGLYKNSKMNEPYEICDRGMVPIYRQSIKEGKEEIYNRLERAAIEEGLRK